MDILRDADVFAPAIVEYGGAFHVFSRTELIASGVSIAEAMDAGGFLPPRPRRLPLFVAVDFNVVRGGDGVCICRSKSMAKRVAHALNEYAPDARRT
jgi:hypothetical protein